MSVWTSRSRQNAMNWLSIAAPPPQRGPVPSEVSSQFVPLDEPPIRAVAHLSHHCQPKRFPFGRTFRQPTRIATSTQQTSSNMATNVNAEALKETPIPEALEKQAASKQTVDPYNVSSG